MLWVDAVGKWKSSNLFKHMYKKDYNRTSEFTNYQLKFVFSKKATKIDEIFTVGLTITGKSFSEPLILASTNPQKIVH